jgi:LPS export ABC transporter protein LptC
MKVKLLLAFLAVLAVVSLVVLNYWESGVNTYPSYKISSMRGFHLTHKENDKIKWELKAEKATFPEDTKEVLLKDLTMRISHDREMSLSGGSGIYDIEEKTLVIKKPIEIDIEGATLITDSLTWNGQKGILSTDEWFTFKDKYIHIEGKGLTAKVKEQQIRILKNVKGTFYH